VDRTNGAISAGMRRQIPTAERKECVPLVPTHNVQSAPLKTRQIQPHEFGYTVQFMENFYEKKTKYLKSTKRKQK
jgi:hypothetical protein